MAMDADGRNGNKRFHQRLAPPDRANNKVCYHWRAGRCNRHPCPFLHSELPPHQQQQSVAPDGGAVAKRNNVWRNPGTASAASGPPSKWGKGRGGGAVGRPPGRASDRICHYFLAGNCTYGENCRFLHSWFISDSFSLLTPLQGHQKGCLQAVSGIALPSGSDKLYSGSMDESVRAWDCQTGQAWNTQTATELSLDGPSGQVYSLVVGNEFLFAGTQCYSLPHVNQPQMTSKFGAKIQTYPENPGMGGSLVGTGGAAAKSTLKTGYGWFNRRQLPENLCGGGTIVAQRRFNCRNFRKSDSLHFSNFDLNLILTNSLVN
ncbi:hypothetical protein BHM03_00062922 [Ensete ventricosum]|nr:hypothetical protein BHM03_00062922 [Ensete ventricosum]